MTSLCRVAAVARQVSSRSLYMSASCHKQIKHTETEQRIVVEGVMPAPAAPAPADSVSACGGGKHQCHPFCKSPIVNKVKHTDVLILDQFVDSKGEMYSMHDLKICTVSSRCRMYYILINSPCSETMVEAAQAGADVPEGGADAGQGVLLFRLQTNQVGQSELLLGRENY